MGCFGIGLISSYRSNTTFTSGQAGLLPRAGDLAANPLTAAGVGADVNLLAGAVSEKGRVAVIVPGGAVATPV
jgi:hypothetical protein